jgi:cellulose synthase/poly-beta-1,6-N-acetylglucosamine synthase-like glycosyltransferase
VQRDKSDPPTQRSSQIAVYNHHSCISVHLQRTCEPTKTSQAHRISKIFMFICLWISLITHFALTSITFVVVLKSVIAFDLVIYSPSSWRPKETRSRSELQNQHGPSMSCRRRLYMKNTSLEGYSSRAKGAFAPVCRCTCYLWKLRYI